MRIGNYYDEFLNNSYLRDFRFIGKTKKVCHAPKWQTTTSKQNKYAKNWLLKQRNNKIAKYTRLYGALAYYGSIIDYQLANEYVKLFNHWFFDFDAHNSAFEVIKHKQNDATENLTGREYFKTMDMLQKEIQELIFNEDFIKQSWNESQIVHDYFQQQGLKTYCCLSSSKGVHLRVFFNPIRINNYDRIVEDVSKNLIKEFNLKTLDMAVATSPSKSVERLPYTYNEKSGLMVVPFEFGVDSLDDVLAKAKRPKVEDFKLSDYINIGFDTALKDLDNKVAIEVAKEQQAMEKLQQEQALQRSVNGAYTGGTLSVKDDLRKLVRFICGDENLVKEHEHYDKWKCVFHEDKNASAIVSKSRYQCLSSNCRIGKINYFDFIKEWFHLTSDVEVKDKIVELQELMDNKNGTAR